MVLPKKKYRNRICDNSKLLLMMLVCGRLLAGVLPLAGVQLRLEDLVLFG
jgi:hypothetical protein